MNKPPQSCPVRLTSYVRRLAPAFLFMAAKEPIFTRKELLQCILQELRASARYDVGL